MTALRISPISPTRRAAATPPARRRLALESADHLLPLRRGQFVVLDDAAPTRLSCLQGDLWVTQQGRPEDLLLRAGDSLWLRAPGRTLIEALSSATATLSTRGIAT